MPRGPVPAGQPWLRELAGHQVAVVGQLAGRGYLVTALHKGKNLILSADGARLAIPSARRMARMRTADPGWRRVLDHLAAAGPATVDDLIAELRVKRRELALAGP